MLKCGKPQQHVNTKPIVAAKLLHSQLIRSAFLPLKKCTLQVITNVCQMCPMRYLDSLVAELEQSQARVPELIFEA